MKTKIKKITLFVVICLPILFYGCVGTNHSSVHDRGQVVVSLNQNNYRIVKRVTGEVSCTKFLGVIGGLSAEYLRNSAISKMYDNAQLTGSQAIIDIHVVRSSSFYFMVSHESMIATGTVIEFTGSNVTNVRMTD